MSRVEGTERHLQRNGHVRLEWVVNFGEDYDYGGGAVKVEIIASDEEKRGCLCDVLVVIVIREMMMMHVIQLCQMRYT